MNAASSLFKSVRAKGISFGKDQPAAAATGTATPGNNTVAPKKIEG